MRIELVGGLGVGKSTLAEAFERKGFTLRSEQIEEFIFKLFVKECTIED